MHYGAVILSADIAAHLVFGLKDRSFHSLVLQAIETPMLLLQQRSFTYLPLHAGLDTRGICAQPGVIAAVVGVDFADFVSFFCTLHLVLTTACSLLCSRVTKFSMKINKLSAIDLVILLIFAAVNVSFKYLSDLQPGVHGESISLVFITGHKTEVWVNYGTKSFRHEELAHLSKQISNVC